MEGKLIWRGYRSCPACLGYLYVELRDGARPVERWVRDSTEHTPASCEDEALWRHTRLGELPESARKHWEWAA